MRIYLAKDLRALCENLAPFAVLVYVYCDYFFNAKNQGGKRKEYKKNKTRTMRIYLAKDLHALCEKLSALCVVCICFSLQGIPTPGEEIIE